MLKLKFCLYFGCSYIHIFVFVFCSEHTHTRGGPYLQPEPWTNAYPIPRARTIQSNPLWPEQKLTWNYTSKNVRRSSGGTLQQKKLVWTSFEHQLASIAYKLHIFVNSFYSLPKKWKLELNLTPCCHMAPLSLFSREFVISAPSKKS